jgi:glycosyltransferase involved in cell wall biosynthesis
MRVSMFSSWGVPCGIADYTRHLVAALREAGGVEVDVVPFDRQAHPRADYVRWGRMMNAGQVAHVQHEYAFFGYRLPWTNAFGAFAAQIRRPLVITRHVSFDAPLVLLPGDPQRRLRQVKWSLYNRWLGPYAAYLNRGMFERGDHVIVLSRHLKDQLVARGMAPGKISVVPPGLPALPAPTGGERLRAQWGWHDRRVIGMFGFITAAKGHLLALDALARLPQSHVLLIAGGVRRAEDQRTLDLIVQRSADLGLAGRVRITGYLPEADVPAHISACDVLVYPYTRVDTSYSLAVGLAYRWAPAVVSDVAAHREVAEESEAVLLFPSGDADGLARQISLALNDAPLRARLLANARRFAERRSWRAVAEQTRAIYEQVLAAAAQRRTP